LVVPVNVMPEGAYLLKPLPSRKADRTAVLYITSRHLANPVSVQQSVAITYDAFHMFVTARYPSRFTALRTPHLNVGFATEYRALASSVMLTCLCSYYTYLLKKKRPLFCGVARMDVFVFYTT